MTDDKKGAALCGSGEHPEHNGSGRCYCGMLKWEHLPQPLPVTGEGRDTTLRGALTAAEAEIIDGALSNFIDAVRESDDVDPQYGVDARHLRNRLRRGELVVTAATVVDPTVPAGCRYCRQPLTDDQERRWGMCGSCHDDGARHDG